VNGRKLGISLSAVLSGDAVSKLATAATSLLALQALAPSAFGTYAGLQATGILAAGAWDLGGSTLVVRRVARGDLRVSEWLVSLLRIRLTALPLALGVVIVGLRILGGDSGVPPGAIVVFVAAAATASISLAALAALRGSGDFGRASAYLAVGRITTTVLTLPCLLLPGDYRLTGLLSAWFAGESVSLILAATSTGCSRGRPGISLAVRSAIPYAANTMVQTAYNRFDVVIVGALSSSPVLGIYAAASRAQDAMFLVPTAIATIALPLAARSRTFWPVMRPLLALTAAGSVLTAVAATIGAPVLVPAVLGPSYVGAVLPIQVIAWSVPLVGVTAVLAAFIAGAGDPRWITAALVAALLVSAGSLALLVPSLGAVGGSVAGVAREFPVLLILGLGVWRTQRSTSRGRRHPVGINDRPASVAGL
jgi:O-antigen/teichoic acid export membrane protein